MPIVKCQHCKKEFEVTQGRINSGRARYCSRKCSADALRKKPDGVCNWCRKPFKKRTKRQKCCSSECARATQMNTSQHAKQDASFSMVEDPWISGAIPPDRYGKDLYRMPDFGCGF